MSLFVLDTNTFIQAYRAHYPIDVVPSFWNKLKQLIIENKVISIDKVKDEIYKNDDELKEWLSSNIDAAAFHPTQTTEVLIEYRKLSNWANSRSDHFQPKAITEFLDADNADAWLIAFCMQSGDVIVTQEVSAPNSKSKIKIPDVCDTFNVNYINTIKLFRELNVQL